MNPSKSCQQPERWTKAFNASHFQVKSKIFLGLCIVLGAGLISVPAADTPAPAAVRATDAPSQAAVPATLEQKPDEWNRPQPSLTPAMRRSPVLITPSGIEKKPRRLYAAIGFGKC